jgi:hypothetical protein
MTENTKKEENDKKFAKTTENENFESWLKTVNLRNGGVHFVSGKGYGKSTALKAVARYYAKQPDTTVIICDTILNWCLDFDTCPYYTVKQDAIKEQTKNVEIEDGKSYLTWAKEYIIDSEPFEFLNEMIKRKEHLILYNVELQEIETVGIFQAKTIDWLYQRQRIKKKYWKGNIPEQYVLISEETEAVFDNTLDRRIMSRTRKQYSEMANLRIAMFSCSQRLQEISTKFRGKMDSYEIGHTSIEDFDLKLNRMLKNSKHRNEILNLPRGSWLDTKSDSIVTFPDFKAVGAPYEIKFKTQSQTNQEFYDNLPLWKRIVCKIMMLKPIKTPEQPQQEDESDDTESELDGYMTDTDDSMMMPTDED